MPPSQPLSDLRLRPLRRVLPLTKRDDGDRRYWYWSTEAAAIKYGIFFGILLLFVILLTAAWVHAKKRMQRGEQPLGYHKWLIPRSRRRRLNGQPNTATTNPENNFTFYQQDAYNNNYPYSYNMTPMPPPPAYNPNFQQPPSYEPPAAGSGAPGKEGEDGRREGPPGGEGVGPSTGQGMGMGMGPGGRYA